MKNYVLKEPIVVAAQIVNLKVTATLDDGTEVDVTKNTTVTGLAVSDFVFQNADGTAKSNADGTVSIDANADFASKYQAA